MDVKAIKNSISREIKTRIVGKKTYGSEWKDANDEWYKKIHDSNYLIHEDFIRYFNKRKSQIKTILEIGCGTGIYPVKNKEIFKTSQYLGIDISQDAIDFCKKNSPYKFRCGDFIKMDLKEKFDLVFSHAVIDHVYDIDTFLKRIVNATTKFAFVNSYRGYFPDLKEHKMKWRDDQACYFNDVSITQLKQVLLNCNLMESEFIIRSQDNGYGMLQTTIEITKNKNIL
jgi:SAM-dependent methyltransferase